MANNTPLTTRHEQEMCIVQTLYHTQNKLIKRLKNDELPEGLTYDQLSRLIGLILAKKAFVVNREIILASDKRYRMSYTFLLLHNNNVCRWQGTNKIVFFGSAESALEDTENKEGFEALPVIKCSVDIIEEYIKLIDSLIDSGEIKIL